MFRRDSLQRKLRNEPHRHLYGSWYERGLPRGRDHYGNLHAALSVARSSLFDAILEYGIHARRRMLVKRFEARC